MLKTLDPQTLAFRDDVLAGLSAPIPAIPARWLYDLRGSELFDEITRLPSYYPTRTETAIFHDDHARGRRARPRRVPLSSNSEQARQPRRRSCWRRSRLPPTSRWTSPATISSRAPATCSERFPSVEVMPVVADFARPFTFPAASIELPKLGFFPGSTIGNFVPWSATDLLRQFRALLGPGSQLLIGMDRVKPVERLIAAYNDPEGVTAEFNLNLLTRINRELDGDIPARRLPSRSALERHPLADRDAPRRHSRRRLSISGKTFHFDRGSSIHTENSHKYGPAAAGCCCSPAAGRRWRNGQTALATSRRSSPSRSQRGLRRNRPHR